MGTISGIIKILEVFLLAVQFVFKIIDKAVLTAKLEKIHNSVNKAKSPDLATGLEGVEEIEDTFNDSTK